MKSISIFLSVLSLILAHGILGEFKTSAPRSLKVSVILKDGEVLAGEYRFGSGKSLEVMDQFGALRELELRSVSAVFDQEGESLRLAPLEMPVLDTRCIA